MLFYSWTSKTFCTSILLKKENTNETKKVIEDKVGHLQSQDFNVIGERKEILGTQSHSCDRVTVKPD